MSSRPSLKSQGTALRSFAPEHNVLWPRLPLDAFALVIATILVLAMFLGW